MVPSLSVKTLDGRPAMLQFGSQRPLLLYIFTPECGWCKRNLRNIQHLSAAVSAQYDVAGISLTQASILRDYMHAEGDEYRFPVYAEPSSDTRRSLRLGATPHTILVGGDGRFVREWRGAFGGRTGQEIEKTFNVRLPGLTD
jgi:hypothetical protein